MGRNCVPFVADLFYTATKEIILILLTMTIKLMAFNSTSRYLDDLLNIGNPYFEGMINQIYPPGLQLNKANTAETEAPFLDLHLSIANEFVSSKIYDTRDDFDFDIIYFLCLDGDVLALHIKVYRFRNLLDTREINNSQTSPAGLSVS